MILSFIAGLGVTIVFAGGAVFGYGLSLKVNKMWRYALVAWGVSMVGMSIIGLARPCMLE